MIDENGINRSDKVLGAAIRNMPDQSPPSDFTASVMAQLEPKQTNVFKRMFIWFMTPRPVSISPLVASCMVVLVFLAVGGIRLLSIDESRFGQKADGLVPVSFVLNDPGKGLQSVAVLGSFNDWEAGGYEMHYSSEAGGWVYRTSLPAGDHEYVFLVNGKRLVTDPGATLSMDDGFGNRNSLLMIRKKNEQTL